MQFLHFVNAVSQVVIATVMGSAAVGVYLSPNNPSIPTDLFFRQAINHAIQASPFVLAGIILAACLCCLLKKADKETHDDNLPARSPS